MPKMVAIQYKCSCMKEEATFEMPARRFNEDISDFMERMQKWLGQDHSERSPFCRATKTEYVKIAVPESGAPIGSSKEDLN
jgi:hypothetical protein